MTKQNKFAVFDIDGTLIRWQLYHAIVSKLAELDLLGTNDHAVIKQARLHWKYRETPESFREYEQVIIQVYENALKNIPVLEFERNASEVVNEYKDQVYVYTRNLISKLKKDGYFLLAISGSHQELIEQIATYYQFDDFVGTQYKQTNGVYNGEHFKPSLDKKSVLQKFISKHDLSIKGSIAIGDSKGDAAMLELVENPIAFNPDKALFETAKANNWKIVIERKNMIYELEEKNGNYLLV